MSTNYAYNNMQHLARVTDSQPGTYVSIVFAPVTDVLHISRPHPGKGTIAAVTLKSGKSWYTAKMPPINRDLSEVVKDSEAGPYTDITVRCYVPFEAEQNHLTANFMKYARWVVVLTTAAGLQRVVGSIGNGAKFSHSFTTGANFRSTPGIDGMFTWQNEDIAGILNAENGVGPLDPNPGGGTGGPPPGDI